MADQTRVVIAHDFMETYGGAELDLFHSVAFLEELGRTGYAGFRAAVSVHSGSVGSEDTSVCSSLAYTLGSVAEKETVTMGSR